MKSLILGGVKSGKSRHAESLAEKTLKPVTFIATAMAHDVEMSKRIAHHKEQRPKNWVLIEEPYQLGSAIESSTGSGLSSKQCLVVDCLTLWVTQLLILDDEIQFEHEKAAFINAITRTPSDLIIVSNENNMGVVPMGELSRRYCDEIGLLHQHIATLCDSVVLCVAGLPMVVKGETPISKD